MTIEFTVKMTMDETQSKERLLAGYSRADFNAEKLQRMWESSVHGDLIDCWKSMSDIEVQMTTPIGEFVDWMTS